MYYEMQFPVRYYETDQMAVVHHSNYIRYFECARNNMIAELGYPIERCEAEGITIPVVKVECNYKFPARMGDTLTVSASIDKIPMAKLVINHKVTNQLGQVCAEGYVLLGFLNKETGRPTSCPKPMIEMIEKHLNDR